MDCAATDDSASKQLEEASADANNVVTNVNDGGGDVKDDVVIPIDKAASTSSSCSYNGGEAEDGGGGETQMNNNNNMMIVPFTSSSLPLENIASTCPMMIVKGKRTRRQRLHSPIPLSVALTIGDRTATDGQEEHLENENQDQNRNNGEDDQDQEQLDMAKCLIMLAQGHSKPPTHYYETNNSSSPFFRRNDLGLFTKMSSGNSGRRLPSEKRSYSVAAPGGVYECKTCNRTFPSFQALGGHRASHKKLKILTDDPMPVKQFTVVDDDNNSSSRLMAPSPLSLHLGNSNNYRTPAISQSHNKSSKVHECSICGAEFTSGQALGGHMRRHRGPVPLNSSSTTTTTTTTTTMNNINQSATIANTTLSLGIISMEPAGEMAVVKNNDPASGPKVNQINGNNSNAFLSLDLNLPASPEDQDHNKIALIPKQSHSQQQEQQQPQQQQQSALVFSTPALVDCFY